MNELLRVGIIGDFDPQLRYHLATNEALRHAAHTLSLRVDTAWLPTESLDHAGCEATLKRFDALWCAPASPYKSMHGALKAIQWRVKRTGRLSAPEEVFNILWSSMRVMCLAIQDAEHEETAPEAPRLVISKLTCSLVGTTQTIMLVPGSLAHRAYGTTAAMEQFACNYGLNPVYREHISAAGCKSRDDLTGEVRIVELGAHRFFMATLFLPQVSSGPDRPHPLIVAYLQAAQHG